MPDKRTTRDRRCSLHLRRGRLPDGAIHGHVVGLWHTRCAAAVVNVLLEQVAQAGHDLRMLRVQIPALGQILA